MRMALFAIGASLLLVSAASAAPSGGFVSPAFRTSWTALPTTRFVAGTPAQVTLLKTRAASVPDKLLDDAFASARDGQQRRDVTLLEISTGWAQAPRTALWDAREAEKAYDAAAATFTPDGHSERFVALVRQIDDGAGRSAASAEDVEAADASVGPAYAAAFDAMDPMKRDALRESQTSWLAYREAMLTLTAAKSPGLVSVVRRQMDERRTSQLAAIAR